MSKNNTFTILIKMGQNVCFTFQELNLCKSSELLLLHSEHLSKQGVNEEIQLLQAYGVERGRKRSSVDSVFGMYHEDPIMKRSSIAIQYGPTGE